MLQKLFVRFISPIMKELLLNYLMFSSTLSLSLMFLLSVFHLLQSSLIAFDIRTKPRVFATWRVEPRHDVDDVSNLRYHLFISLYNGELDSNTK